MTHPITVRHACVTALFRTCAPPHIAIISVRSVGSVPAALKDLEQSVVSAVWAIEDNTGQVLPGLTGASRIELGRRVLPGRYDPFRLHVSASYREMFERDLRRLLAFKGWQIVRAKTRRRPTAVRRDMAPLQEAA